VTKDVLLLQMSRTTSLNRAEGNGTDLGRLENEWTLKIRETVHKWNILLGNNVSMD
jgi:hypothetical protein